MNSPIIYILFIFSKASIFLEMNTKPKINNATCSINELISRIQKSIDFKTVLKSSQNFQKYLKASLSII